MFLKNEDVKIGTIPDANGSDNPLKKMEFLTEKEMKDSSRLFGKVIVPPGSALAYHTHECEGEAYHILQGRLVNRWSAAVRNFSLHHSRNGKSHRRKRHLKPARTSKRA